MWCVIQVFTGREEYIRHACIKYIDKEILKDTFIPLRVRQRKYSGEWKDEKCVILPGYVFLVTDDPKKLHQELKKVEGMTKLLRDENNFLTLTPEEEVFIQNIINEEYLVKMSVGFIEGDKVTVTEGPLMGLEGLIRKIDRHKRQCIIETEMFGQKTRITMGLEIVSKN